MTRAEALKIFILAAGVDIPRELQDYNGTSFLDVTETDWYYPYVMVAKKYGLIQGYLDGSFRPHAPLTRAEAAKIVMLFSEKRKSLSFIGFSQSWN